MRNKYIKTILSAIFVCSFILAGCGDSGDNPNGVPGGIGSSVINGMVVNPNGSRSISFSGSTPSASGSRVLIGTFPYTAGNIQCPSYSTGYVCFQKSYVKQLNTSGGSYLNVITYQQANVLGQTFGTLSLGINGINSGYMTQKADNVYRAVDGGQTNVNFSVNANNYQGGTSVATVSGVINISQQFSQYELGNQSITAIGLDLTYAGSWTGKVFLTTTPNHGSFIEMAQ